MASSTNQVEQVLAKSGKPLEAELVVPPPTEIPVGQKVRYVAVLKLKEEPDWDTWKYFMVTAYAVNDTATKDEPREKQPRIELGGGIGPLATGYPIQIPGKSKKEVYFTFSTLVFPEKGTFRLKFNLAALKWECLVPKGSPDGAGKAEATSVLSELVTVKEADEMQEKIRKVPEDWSETERVILTAIEKHRPEVKRPTDLQPTIFFKPENGLKYWVLTDEEEAKNRKKLEDGLEEVKRKHNIQG